MAIPTPRRKRLLSFYLLAVLALLGASASKALAFEGPHWAIKGSTLTDLSLSSESLNGELKAEATKIVVPGFSVTFICKATALSEATIEKEGKGKGVFKLSTCSTEKEIACAVEPITIKAKSHLVADVTEIYEVFEPLTEGGSFGTVVTKGALCALPKESKLTGAFATPVSTTESVQQSLAPLASGKASALLGIAEFKFGIKSATLESAVLASLAGANKGKVWAGSLNSGNVLCEFALEVCDPTVDYSGKSTLEGKLEEGTEAVFVTGLGTAKCKEASIKGQTTEAETKSLPGEISTLSFASCKSGETSCTASAESLPFHAQVDYTEVGAGSLQLSAIGGSPAIKLLCEGIVNCTFASPSKLSFEGDEPSRLLAVEAPLAVVSGSLCPKASATPPPPMSCSSPAAEMQCQPRSGARGRGSAQKPRQTYAVRPTKCTRAKKLKVKWVQQDLRNSGLRQAVASSGKSSATKRNSKENFKVTESR